MGKYLLLYTVGNTNPPQTVAERAAVMQAWMDWFGRLGSAVADAGNPTSPLGKTVASNGSVSGVPAGLIVGGYSILAADSLDAAVDMAKGCPQLDAGGDVQVFETFDVM